MINRIYGILATGVVVSLDTVGYRYSDAAASNGQLKLLKGLMPADSGSSLVFIDYLLKLLSCSPYWPEVIRTFDPQNSYDISVIDQQPECVISLGFNPLSRLLEWADKIPTSTKYPTADNDPRIDVAISKLLGVLDNG